MTYERLLQACYIACQRRLAGIVKRRSEPYGSPENPWEQEIYSSIAECWLSEVTGQPWNALGPMYGGDVGAYEVRWTRHPHGHLRIQRPDEGTFFLITGTLEGRGEQRMMIRGWEAAEVVKDLVPYTDIAGTGRPAHWGPQRLLADGGYWEQFHVLEGWDDN